MLIALSVAVPANAAAPMIDAGISGDQSTSEGAAPVILEHTVTVFDADGAVQSASVVIAEASYQAGDVLSYTAPAGNPVQALPQLGGRGLFLFDPDGSA